VRARGDVQVLVLDGGGLRGVFSLVILQKIEEITGQPVRDLFDLIVGCSTGGVIALGSGILGRSASDGLLT
jgi:patatin-like phospholipase/acyl hydrolase